MKLIYIAGPFSAENDIEIEANIIRAERLGEAVRQAGAFPVIPHANGRAFKHLGTYTYWIEGTLELMKRCDAVILVPGWHTSKGTHGEVAEANARFQPVFETVDQLKVWLAEQDKPKKPCPKCKIAFCFGHD